MILLISITTWLNNNQWLNLIFLFLALISIILTLIFYLKSKKKKQPIYTIKSFSLIREKLTKLKDVKITYKEEDIDNLTLTKIALWNKGNDTINSYDVAPKDWIRVEINNEYDILESEIIFIKKNANNFKIDLNENRKIIRINFDYFHTNEGFIFQFYHTGKSSQNIKVLGTIKGVNKIEYGNIEDDYYANLFWDKTLGKLRIKKWPRLSKVIFFPLIVVIFIPVGFVLFPLDIIYKYKKRKPREYNL